jgi:hypothetical protein
LATYGWLLSGSSSTIGCRQASPRHGQARSRLCISSVRSSVKQLSQAVNGENKLFIGGGAAAYNAVNTIRFYTAPNSTITTGSERATIDSAGRFGIGQTSPTAFLHLKAGAAAANSGPMKFEIGVNLTDLKQE